MEIENTARVKKQTVYSVDNPVGTNSVLLNVSIDDERYMSGDDDSYNGMHIGLDLPDT